MSSTPTTSGPRACGPTSSVPGASSSTSIPASPSSASAIRAAELIPWLTGTMPASCSMRISSPWVTAPSSRVGSSGSGATARRERSGESVREPSASSPLELRFWSQGIGVRRAPPRDSSLPRLLSRLSVALVQRNPPPLPREDLVLSPFTRPLRRPVSITLLGRGCA